MAKQTVRKGLKNTFVPHSRNRYKPHITKHYGLATVLACLLFIQIAYNFSVTGTFQILGYATNVSHSGLLYFTNQNRVNQGLPDYRLNEELSVAAYDKARHMVQNNYWSHYSPDGSTPWDFIDGVGYKYLKAGENLAYGFTDSSGVVSGWMDSPAHKANILDSSFTEVGFGVANGSDFQGNENTVIVAMYGQPISVDEVNDESLNTVASESSETPPANLGTEEAEATTQDKPVAWTHNDLKDLNQAVLAVDTFAVASPAQSEVSLLNAIISGNANWGIYLSIAVLGLMTLSFIFRHALAIYQFAVHGEHYIEGHPLLEAGLLYGLMWLALVSTYGVIA